jgi:hypothetical protein
LEQFGIDDQIQHKGCQCHPLSGAIMFDDKEIAVIRSGEGRNVPGALRFASPGTHLKSAAYIKNLTPKIRQFSCL